MTPQSGPSTSTKPLNPFAPTYTPLLSRNPPPPPPPALYFLPFSQPPFHPHYHYSTYQNPFPPPLLPPHTKVVARDDGRRRRRRRNDFDTYIAPRFPTNETNNSTEKNRHQVVPLKRNEEKTTIMIKNIPYDCIRKRLITILDEFCSVVNDKAKNEGTSRSFTSAYDFIYLPIDFKSKKGRGFAFVNFTNAGAVWKFFDAFHFTSWPSIQGLNSSKKIEIVCAKLQGKEALVNHFSGSIFECETDEFLPALFRPPRDGSGQAVELTVVGNRRAPSARYYRRLAKP